MRHNSLPLFESCRQMLDQSDSLLGSLADLRLQVTVIHNPISGWRNYRKLRRFVETAMLRGLTVIVRTTRHAGEAEAIAADVASDGWTEVVVVAGGDGTINEVINGLASRLLKLVAVRACS